MNVPCTAQSFKLDKDGNTIVDEEKEAEFDVIRKNECELMKSESKS